MNDHKHSADGYGQAFLTVTQVVLLGIAALGGVLHLHEARGEKKERGR